MLRNLNLEQNITALDLFTFKQSLLSMHQLEAWLVSILTKPESVSKSPAQLRIEESSAKKGEVQG